MGMLADIYCLISGFMTEDGLEETLWNIAIMI